jgi:hypothetical protein
LPIMHVLMPRIDVNGMWIVPEYQPAGNHGSHSSISRPLSSNTESDIGAVQIFIGKLSSACDLTNSAARQAMDLLDC